MWCLSASGDRFDFQVAVLGRDTPPAPLEGGDWGAAFFLKVWSLSGEVSPLERGDSGTYFFLKVSKLYKGCCFLSPVQEKYLVYVFFNFW